MELSNRIELIDSLLVEATQKMEVLRHASAAEHRAGQVGASDAPGTSYHQEPFTLQAEREWWEKAHQALTTVRNAFQQIEISERQRGAST